MGVALVLAVAGGAGALLRLQFRAGRNELIDPSQPYFRAYETYNRSFAGDALLLVVIQVDGDPTRAARAVRHLQQALRPHVGRELEAVHAERGLEFLRARALLLAPEADLARFEQRLFRDREKLAAFARYPDLAALLEDIERRLDAGGAAGERPAEGVGFLERLLAAIEAATVGRPAPPVLAGMRPPAPGPLDPYFVSDSGKLIFLYLEPQVTTSELNYTAAAVSVARQALECVRRRFPGLRAGLTGRPALDADEMTSTQRDMQLACAIALFGVTLLFAAVFRGLLQPLLAVLALLLAIAASFGCATLYPGYLNLLSIVFALILIGLGIDFGIYLLAGYRTARAIEPTPAAAVRATLLRVGPPMLGGAVTTVIAFYTALFVDFRGVAELGLLAGTGVLLCLVSMLFVLPALLLLFDRPAGPSVRPPAVRRRPWRFPRRAAPILLLALALSAALLPGIPRLRFSYNPRELLARGLESVAYEQLVHEQSGQSTWFGVTSAPTREALRERIEKLARLEQVKQVRSVLDIWPLGEAERRRRLAALQIPAPAPRSAASPDPGRIVALLRRLAGGFEGAADDLFLSRPALAGRLVAQGERCGRIAAGLRALPAGQAAPRLLQAQRALLGELDETLRELARLADPPPATIDSLPAFYRRLFVARGGAGFAAHVHPALDITRGAAMARYLDACLAVDPGFTGPPMLFYRTSRLMRHGFERASWYALVAILVVLVLALRRPSSILLACTPLALGLLWTAGLMGYLDLRLDLANCFGVPILLGIGIDVGIHLVHAFRATGKVDPIWDVTGRAVLVTTLTTIIGFGSMLVAHHRGLAGLGKLVCLGMCAVLLAALVVLPAIFRLLERTGPDDPAQ